MPKFFDGIGMPVEIIPRQKVPERRPEEAMLHEMRLVAQNFGYTIADLKMRHTVDNFHDYNLEIEMRLVNLRGGHLDDIYDDPVWYKYKPKKPHEMTPEEFEHYATAEAEKVLK